MPNATIKIPGMADVISLSRVCLSPAKWASRHIQKPDHLLGEVFSTTTRALFVADTGLGKTMFGLATAFAMSIGRDFLHWKAVRPAKVLYLDGEMPRELIKERVVHCFKTFGVSDAPNLSIVSTEELDLPPLDTEGGADGAIGVYRGKGSVRFYIFRQYHELVWGGFKKRKKVGPW